MDESLHPRYTLVAFKPSFFPNGTVEDGFGEEFLLLEDLQESELIQRIAELRLQVYEPDEPAWDTIRYFGPWIHHKYVEDCVAGIMAPVLEERRKAKEEDDRLEAIKQAQADAEHEKKAAEHAASVMKMLEGVEPPDVT